MGVKATLPCFFFVQKCSLADDGSRCRSARAKRSAPRVVWLGPIVVINGSTGTGRVAINGMDEYSDATEYMGEMIPRILEGQLRHATPNKAALDNVFVVIFVSAAVTLLLVISYAYVRSFRK